MTPLFAPDIERTEIQRSLYERFEARISVDETLSRKLVSYQGNKQVPGLRWLKYKEGFSTQLVESLLARTGGRKLLDPFSGSGVAPLTASSKGMDGTGIEIMPLGNRLARAIVIAANDLNHHHFVCATKELISVLPDVRYDASKRFQHVPITEQAFTEETEIDLARARSFIQQVSDRPVRELLTLACLSVLEEVSYTRKDGQFLRWDPQSGRNVRPKLHKHSLPTLSQALQNRFDEMSLDIPLLRERYRGAAPHFIDGSSLTELRKLPDGSFDTVITSPPYANRYDYTRIYALELAYLGYSENQLKELRQASLSATVENRSKRELLRKGYGDSAQLSGSFAMADSQAALQEALSILKENARDLSNRNVIDLVENYFTEMAVIIGELGRIVSRSGSVFMVNDNVRYHGQEIPVDLILSDFAEQCGFRCENIWTLNRGKGNSSQQMGRFGRRELRKCVYHWRKTDG